MFPHTPSVVGELENTVSLSPPPPSVGVWHAVSTSLHGRSLKERKKEVGQGSKEGGLGWKGMGVERWGEWGRKGGIGEGNRKVTPQRSQGRLWYPITRSLGFSVSALLTQDTLQLDLVPQWNASVSSSVTELIPRC